jgi:uncharacterized protein
MRPSRYNVYVDQAEGCFVYNGVSGAVIKVPRGVFDRLRTGKTTPAMRHDTLLVDNGVITAAPEEQIDALKKRYEQVIRPTNECTFVVSPTTHCNLRCPYCYEHSAIPGKTNMTAATADRVARFVCHEMSPPSRKVAVLKFYGGEPLLKFDLCCRMARAVSKWCKKHGKTLITWVQTNGSLITEATPFDKLPDLACVEITLDGDESRHNRLRTNGARVKTYERIIHGIGLLSQRKIPVSVRVNMHSRDEVLAAMKDLQRHGVMEMPNVFFYDGQVSDTFFDDRFRTGCIGHVQSDEHLKMVREVRAAVRESGCEQKYQKFPLFKPRVGVCGFAKPGSYCIDPKGDLYSCVFQQCRPRHRIGTITADGSPRFDPLYERIMTRSPFAFEKCVGCSILPQCWGGCFAQAVDRYGTVETSCCGTMPDIVPAMINAGIEEMCNEAIKV